jgi:hypothetical protein
VECCGKTIAYPLAAMGFLFLFFAANISSSHLANAELSRFVYQSHFIAAVTEMFLISRKFRYQSSRKLVVCGKPRFQVTGKWFEEYIVANNLVFGEGFSENNSGCSVLGFQIHSAGPQFSYHVNKIVPLIAGSQRDLLGDHLQVQAQCHVTAKPPSAPQTGRMVVVGTTDDGRTYSHPHTPLAPLPLSLQGGGIGAPPTQACPYVQAPVPYTTQYQQPTEVVVTQQPQQSYYPQGSAASTPAPVVAMQVMQMQPQQPQQMQYQEQSQQQYWQQQQQQQSQQQYLQPQQQQRVMNFVVPPGAYPGTTVQVLSPDNLTVRN